jgi:hypothetical protein
MKKKPDMKVIINHDHKETFTVDVQDWALNTAKAQAFLDIPEPPRISVVYGDKSYSIVFAETPFLEVWSIDKNQCALEELYVVEIAPPVESANTNEKSQFPISGFFPFAFKRKTQ